MAQDHTVTLVHQQDMTADEPSLSLQRVRRHALSRPFLRGAVQSIPMHHPFSIR